MTLSRSVKIFVLLFSQGLNTVISLLFLPYLSRALTPIEYGTYGQVLLIVNLIAVALACGLGKVIYSFLADKKYAHIATLSSSVGSSILLGIVGLMIGVGFSSMISSFLNNENVSNLLWIYLIALPFLIGFLPLNASLIYFDKIKESALIAVVTNLLKAILLLASIQILDSLIWVFISLTFIALLQFLSAFNILRKRGLLSIKDIDAGLSLSMIKVGIPLGMTSILGVIYKSTDSLMISNMLSVTDYAIYRNGALEVPFIATLYASIGAIVLPDIAKLYTTGKFNSIIDLKKKVISNTLGITIPIFLILLLHSKSLLIFYLSSTYEESVPIFTIFLFSLLLRVTSYEDIFVVSKKSRTILYIYLFSFLLNIVLNYFLIRTIGKNGAALSTIITLFIIAILSIHLSTKLIGKKLLDYFDIPRVLKLTVAAFALYFSFLLINSMLKDWWGLALVIQLLISYYVILKFNFIDRSILLALTSRIPIISKFLTKLVHKI